MPKTKRNYKNPKYSRRKNSRRKYNRRTYKGGVTESRRGSTKAVTNITKTMGQESLGQGGALGWTAIKPGQGKFAQLMQGGVKKVYSANKKILNMYLEIDKLKERFYTDLLSGIYLNEKIEGGGFNKSKIISYQWVNAWTEAGTEALSDQSQESSDQPQVNKIWVHKISGVKMTEGVEINFTIPGGTKTMIFKPLNPDHIVFQQTFQGPDKAVVQMGKEARSHRLDALIEDEFNITENTTSCVSIDYLFSDETWMKEVKAAGDLRSKWVSFGVLAMTAAAIAAVAVGGGAAIGAVTGVGAKLAVGSAVTQAAAPIVAAPLAVRESLHAKQTNDISEKTEKMMRAVGVAIASSAEEIVQGELLPAQASAPSKMIDD